MTTRHPRAAQDLLSVCSARELSPGSEDPLEEEMPAHYIDDLASDDFFHMFEPLHADRGPEQKHVDPGFLSFGKEHFINDIDRIRNDLPPTVAGGKELIVFSAVLFQPVLVPAAQHILPDRFDEAVFAPEMITDGIGLGPGAAGDVPHRHSLGSAGGKEFTRGFQQMFLGISRYPVISG